MLVCLQFSLIARFLWLLQRNWPFPACPMWTVPTSLPRSRPSYLCRIKRKENSSCSACGHHLQGLTHLLLDFSAFEPRRRAIFGTSSILDLGPRPWDVTRLLVSAEFFHAPTSRKGSGSTTNTMLLCHSLLFFEPLIQTGRVFQSAVKRKSFENFKRIPGTFFSRENFRNPGNIKPFILIAVLRQSVCACIEFVVPISASEHQGNTATCIDVEAFANRLQCCVRFGRPSG